MPSPTKYRPDIDGLRAIAVLSVMAFHLGLYRAHGGFVGVDIFFVISGYLICTILKEDLAQDRFSLLRFYERRIKRIIPALLVVLTAAILIAAVIVYPKPYEGLAQSAIAAALSFSNFYFAGHSG